MGTLFSAIARFWKPLSSGMRWAVSVAATAVAIALGWVIEQVVGSYVSDVVNSWLVESIGPLLPAVGQVIASYGISLIAALGLLWVALSFGYWLGLHDPLAKVNVDPRQAVPDLRDRQRRTAHAAITEIRDRLQTVERVAERSYDGPDQKTRQKWWEKFRPEIQANILILKQASLATPPVTSLDEWEVAALKMYIEEVEPYLAKPLFEQAIAVANDTVALIDTAQAQRPKG